MLFRSDGETIAGFVTVYPNADGSFGEMQWTDLTPAVSGGAPFADSVYGNAVVGIAPSSSGVNAYQATVTPGGNLISGNGNAGVRILGDDNSVAWNLIGTTITGAAGMARRAARTTDAMACASSRAGMTMADLIDPHDTRRLTGAIARS